MLRLSTGLFVALWNTTRFFYISVLVATPLLLSTKIVTVFLLACCMLVVYTMYARRSEPPSLPTTQDYIKQNPAAPLAPQTRVFLESHRRSKCASPPLSMSPNSSRSLHERSNCSSWTLICSIQIHELVQPIYLPLPGHLPTSFLFHEHLYYDDFLTIPSLA